MLKLTLTLTLTLTMTQPSERWSMFSPFDQVDYPGVSEHSGSQGTLILTLTLNPDPRVNLGISGGRRRRRGKPGGGVSE